MKQLCCSSSNLRDRKGDRRETGGQGRETVNEPKTESDIFTVLLIKLERQTGERAESMRDSDRHAGGQDGDTVHANQSSDGVIEPQREVNRGER